MQNNQIVLRNSCTGVDKKADTESGIPGASGSIATSSSTATVVVSSSECAINFIKYKRITVQYHFVCQEIICAECGHNRCNN